jgi:pimeloyl-ACP methyl ester carboxylesterase
LATAFSEAGFAVLRYDKRTCGTFNNRCANSYPVPDASLVVDDFQADAAAAIAYLQARPEVDPARVVPVGHSQGSEFIAPLLSDDPALPAGVMLAGPFRPIDALIQYQADFTIQILGALGSTQEEIQAVVGPLLIVSNQLGELRAGTFIGSSIDGIDVGFWQSWMDLGNSREADLEGLSSPVLALSGDYDWNVPPSETESFVALFEGLASDPGHMTVILPCVTHVLNCITQPDWTLIDTSDIGRGIHPPVVQAVVDFLR